MLLQKMMSMDNFKSGFIAVIGRSNVGKSTLINQILKSHFLIVSPKTQTTRNKIKGIYTTDEAQIIFIDTPGFHKSNSKLGDVMNEYAMDSMDGVDLILLVVDGSTVCGKGDEYVMSLLPKNIPAILILNKVDLVKNQDVLMKNIATYREKHDFKSGITISATNDFNIDELLKMIIDNLPYGPKYYPEDQALDLSMRFVASEIIREKILLLTKEEVPYSVAVVIDNYKENDQMIEVSATIICERPSQKKIIIGAGGNMIKQIGHDARLDLKKMLDKNVYLELFVKVEDDWRNKKHYLKEYGYDNDKK